MIREDCLKSLNSSLDTLENLRDSNILITGGTGFIGNWLVESIMVLNREYGFNIKVYIISRNETNVFSFLENPYITFIKTDIRNLKEIPECINYIIHAAGSPDSREHISNPLRTLDTFYKGTQNILEHASRLPNLKKFIHISSNKVYGSNYLSKPIKEEDTRILNFDINDVYSNAKRIAESICSSYISKFSIPITILRPFAFIGPFQSLDKPWAINNFIRDSILGSHIRILGNEKNVKSYMYGSDLASSILNLLLLGEIGQIYNVGSSQEITLYDLANKIKAIVNGGFDVVIKSSVNQYENNQFDVPNIDKITNQLRYKEYFTLDEAIKKTIYWNKIKM